MNIADIRREYRRADLDLAQVAAEPLQQFENWFEQALQAQLAEPTAMTLATVSAQGRPTARTVLLKGYDARGFTFFTNYASRKGRELAANRQASLLFFWAELERQIRIEGSIDQVSNDESDAYFASRPLASRLGAWASAQSEVVSQRSELEARVAEFSRRYGEQVPRPPHWGGYRLQPNEFEFWQGRESRLHDRIRYRLVSGAWVIERLAP